MEEGHMVKVHKIGRSYWKKGKNYIPSSITSVSVTETDREAHCFSCGDTIPTYTKRVEAGAYCYDERKFCKKCVTEGSERIVVDIVKRDAQTIDYDRWTEENEVNGPIHYENAPRKPIPVICKCCGKKMPIGTSRVKFDVYRHNHDSHAWIGICTSCFEAIKKIL
jgi:hypothetical protein